MKVDGTRIKDKEFRTEVYFISFDLIYDDGLILLIRNSVWKNCVTVTLYSNNVVPFAQDKRWV